METEVYRKISSRLEADWYPYRTNEWFTHDDICRFFQWNEQGTRKALSQKLWHDSSGIENPKLEKKNKAYRIIDRELEVIDWVNADTNAVYELSFPYGVWDKTHFDFEKNIRIHPKGIVAIAGVSNEGKGHPYNTPILTDDGFRMIGELSVGDYLFTPNGERTKIKGLYHRGEQDVYKFTFSDGSSIEVDNNHLWKIQTPYQRQKVTGHNNSNATYGKWLLMETRDIIKRFGLGIIKSAKVQIPRTNPIRHFGWQGRTRFPYYLLGLILGDGNLTGQGVRFSTADSELLDYLSTMGIVAKHTSKYDYKLYLGKYAKKMPLGIKKLSKDKFIPRNYLLGSMTNRLQLLRGLMDTDGWAEKSQSCFCSVSKQLAEDVKFLVESLGGIARISARKPKYSYKGIIKEGQRCYIVRIGTNFCPFRLSRKVSKWHKKQKSLNRTLKSIEYVGIKPTICLSIEDKGGLYIAKDFIVTHNTAFVLNILVLNMDKYRCTYFTNELTEIGLKRRFRGFEDWCELTNGEGQPKFKAVLRYDNYQDVIDPDGLNIIDYLDVNAEGEYYKLVPYMKRIQKALKKGIAVIALQKPPGRSDAFGGSNLRGATSLYLSIDKNKLEVVKAKDWVDDNPNGRKYSFSLSHYGCVFENIQGIYEG